MGQSGDIDLTINQVMESKKLEIPEEEQLL